MRVIFLFQKWTVCNMDRVFIYWDNSNIFYEAQRLAEERNEGTDARYRVRINFDNLLRLAHADRPRPSTPSAQVSPIALGACGPATGKGTRRRFCAA